MNNEIIILKNDSGNLNENEYEKIGLDVWKIISKQLPLISQILLKNCSKFLSQLKTDEKEIIKKELKERCEIENPKDFLSMIKKIKE